MTLIKSTVMRNVTAEDELKRPVKVAVALVEHENGVRQRVAIREDKIRAMGEGIIEAEVQRAALMPSGASFLKH